LSFTVISTCELYRIRQQVPDDLLQPIRIAAQQAGVGIEFLDQVNFLRVGSGLNGFDRRLDKGHGREPLRIEPEFARNDRAHVEQVFDELRLHMGIAHDGFQSLGRLRFVGPPARQHMGPSQDRG
jgi:hypothetical protein